MNEHQWEPFGEWGSERDGWSKTYKCSICGAFKLDENKMIQHRSKHSGMILHEEVIPNDESFGYMDCDNEIVKRIMES